MELSHTFNGRLLLLLFVHAMCFLLRMSLSQPLQTTDGLALLSLKASLSGSASSVLSSWNDTLHYCNWLGVTCSSLHTDRVTAVDLRAMKLAGTITPSITNLTFLRKLDLSSNNLRGHIPQDIGSLPRLQFLNLSYNSLDGEIPTSLTQSPKLQVLHLGANQLEGQIPSGLANCTELLIISLRANRLHGDVPSELSTLPKVLRLILGSNNLTGGIPPSLGNLSTLSILDLADNYLEGSIPSTLGQLTSLGALQIGINQLSGTIPPSMYNLSSLSYIHVSTNQLSGTLPSDIGRSFPKLQDLLMIENQFEGTIPESLSNISSLEKIELAGNRFSGRIPSNLGALSNLVEVLLAANQLEDGEAYGWSFLTSLTNCTNLKIIDLYFNKLSGRFPESIANLSTGLQKLAMNRNQITGSIPAGIENLVGLTSLYLEQNLLTGTIPPTIGNLYNLLVLSLHENNFSGQIPSSLGNLSLLTRLTLDDCQLEGSIPTTFGNLENLELLDISSNKLTGNLPKELVSLSSLSRYLAISHNSLSGPLPIEVGNLKNLGLLDISENSLSGEIPSTLGECQIMQFLYMEGNHFQGQIPPPFSNLKGIQELDLSRNNLSGTIPEFLERFQSLQYLNLSFNNFVGEVPMKGIFGNLSGFSLQGNNELCGGHPGLHLQACSIQTSRRHRFPTVAKIILALIGSVCLVLLLSLLIIRYWLKSSSSNAVTTASEKDHYLKASYSELFKATDGFSPANLIGTGSFGLVYKGILEAELKVVAVKILHLQEQGASKSFLAECETLRNIRHRNLVKILTVCSSMDLQGNEFKAIVYDFMPNGSLEEWLHPELCENGQLRNLQFIQRLNIAIDVAAALDYLHCGNQTPIVHCDLKPSNILLDNDMCAHVGDFGLARFLPKIASKPSGDSSCSIGIKGSIGYVAPGMKI